MQIELSKNVQISEESPVFLYEKNRALKKVYESLVLGLNCWASLLITPMVKQSFTPMVTIKLIFFLRFYLLS